MLQLQGYVAQSWAVLFKFNNSHTQKRRSLIARISLQAADYVKPFFPFLLFYFC